MRSACHASIDASTMSGDARANQIDGVHRLALRRRCVAVERQPAEQRVALATVDRPG
jgi:hypothetical protein